MNKKFYSKSKRFLSGLLATTLAVTMLPTTSAMAENSELEYYLSLEANSDEYQAWKSTFSVDDSINEISTYALRSSANGISNEYLEITLNGNYYTLGTTGGNPDSATDNNKKLLFGYPTGGTSYTTIQIDGVNTIFTPETTTYRKNSIISTDVIDDIIVTQYLNIINNQYTGRDDVAEFFYTVENTGSDNHNVGVRIMFDTMLGNNDSAPFRLPNIGDVTTETDLKGSSVPEFWQAFDSLTSPSVIAQGTLNIDKDSTPDRVRFTNWGMAYRNQWDYTRSVGSSNGDSAVCLYWNPKTIGTNQTLSCKTYYGLSSLQQDNAPPLAVAISGATKLEVEEDEHGGKSYSPNPFTVTAYIQNIGTGTAYNANIELTLPDGMSVVNGTNIVSLGDIPVSSTQKQVSWKVSVEPSAIDKIETYGIIVTADNAETKVLERQIEIPALADNSVELWLDRSIITDSNNLNLNFKIVNTSDTPIALNQLLVHYYYIDESPKTEKQFNCYSAYTNEPYSYLPNTAVTLTNHQLESLHNNATHYFEFSFDSDKELLPNQEIIVNSGINNTSWSKIVSSNDYSAVGDDSLASSSYMLWEYMPVFISSDLNEPIWGAMPEIDTDGIEPDLLVELDPNAVNGKGYMNLNIRITNNGILPIDLGQTEIKYYYTNDRGHDQSVAGNYIGGRIDNNYVGITDKVIIEAVKMDVRKKMADTYVSIKFAEDTGTLNFEDYIDLNVQVYNTGWKSGDYILENDHSYQEEEQEIQTFSLRTRAVSNNTGMNNTNFIEVITNYQDYLQNIWLPKTFGKKPTDYEPTFSIFKVGEGTSDANTTDDYYAAYRKLTQLFNAVPYDYRNSMLENISAPIEFNNDNLKSILESDIVYISGHGSRGGVIPIYRNGIRPEGVSFIEGERLYDQIITTDKNVGNDYQHFDLFTYERSKYYNKSSLDNKNIFSLNMKDHQGEDINENLKWVIASACCQLNSETSFNAYVNNSNDTQKVSIDTNSVDRWIDVLKNNNKLKGVLGYWGTAPSAKAGNPDSNVVSKFFEYAEPKFEDGRADYNIYDSWIKANFYTHDIREDTLPCGLIVKGNCDKEYLYSSLCENNEIEYDYIYLYTARFVKDYEINGSNFGHVENNTVIYEAIDAICNSLNTSIDDLLLYQPEIMEVSRNSYNEDGVVCSSITNEIVVSINMNFNTYSLTRNLETSTVVFKYNVEKGELCEW